MITLELKQSGNLVKSLVLEESTLLRALRISTGLNFPERDKAQIADVVEFLKEYEEEIPTKLLDLQATPVIGKHFCVDCPGGMHLTVEISEPGDFDAGIRIAASEGIMPEDMLVPTKRQWSHCKDQIISFLDKELE